MFDARVVKLLFRIVDAYIVYWYYCPVMFSNKCQCFLIKSVTKALNSLGLNTIVSNRVSQPQTDQTDLSE